MRRLSHLLLTAILALALPAAAAAQGDSGFYLSHDIGFNRTNGPELAGHANDFGSICDHAVNPFPNLVPARCNDRTQEGTRWKSVFEGATGIASGAAVGYRFGPAGRMRMEAEYFFTESPFNQNVGIQATDATADTKLARAGGEVVIAEDQLQSLTSHGVFANFYADFPNRSRWTPYAGFGAGIGFTRLDYDLFWVRNSDPAAITSIIAEFKGTPEQLRTLQENLAGTVSSLHTELTDRVFGYQVLFGLDYAVSEAVSIGVKGRYMRFGEFSALDEIDQVRSHDPKRTRGPDPNGIGPLNIAITNPDTTLTAVTVNLKYRF